MSRTYRRTTHRRKQEDRHLSVRVVRQNPPDARKLARAFINLALAQAQAETDAATAADVAAGNAPGEKEAGDASR